MEKTKKSLKETVSNKTFWIALSCAIVLTLGLALGLVFGLKGPKFNLNNMYITNFEDYVALGSATDANSTGAGSMISSNAKKNKKYLVGMKANGEIEKIKVSTEKDGKEEPINWNLRSIHTFNNYTLASFCNPSYDYPNMIEDYIISKGKHSTVIIDNKTGKIYALDEMFDTYTAIGTEVYPFVYSYDGLESSDSIIFLATKYYADDFVEIFYRATIENSDLKVEKLFETSYSSNMVDFLNHLTFTDKYNNIFLSNENHYNNHGPYHYVVTADGHLKSLNGVSIIRCLNGIAYTTDGQYYINEDGEFKTNTFANYNLSISKDYLVKTVGNVQYYYKGKNQITKVTWTNDIEFAYEILTIDDVSSTSDVDYVLTADKIFIRQNESIFYVNITDGQTSELVSDYFFTSIDTDNLGNVIFTALNSQMQTVNGIIKNDNSININVAPREYIVHYIKPIN